MNTAIVVVVSVIWFVIIVVFVYRILSRCICQRAQVSNVYQKGLNEDKVSKDTFKYMCQLIFSGTVEDQQSPTLTSIELIHTSDKGKKTKLVSIIVEPKDIVPSHGFCCGCCGRGFRAFYLIHRLRVLPTITKVRAILHSTKEPIFLKGFEIIDQQTGKRTFFRVDQSISDTDMKTAVVHNVKVQKLYFCSKQTFYPDFHELDYETFGTVLETPANAPEAYRGVRLLPQLNWFEIYIFEIFLVNSMFALMVSIILYLNNTDDKQLTVASILGAGLIAPTVTQIVGCTYRAIVRTNYDFSCSPTKAQRGEGSAFWTVFRYLYLCIFFASSVALTAMVIISVDTDFKLNLRFGNSQSDWQTLIYFLAISVAVVYYVWLPLFAVFRFLCRFIFFSPSSVNSNSKRHLEKENIETDPQDREVSPSSKKEKERSDPSDSLKLRSALSKAPTPPKTPRDADLEEKSEKYGKYEPYSKEPGLQTKSVIVTPTKSLGYLDPETFKLSESRIISSQHKKPVKHNTNKK